MNIIKTCQARLKKLTLCDIACIKFSTAAAALFLAKLCPELLMLEWHWYLVIAIVAAAQPVMKIISK